MTLDQLKALFTDYVDAVGNERDEVANREEDKQSLVQIQAALIQDDVDVQNAQDHADTAREALEAAIAEYDPSKPAV